MPNVGLIALRQPKLSLNPDPIIGIPNLQNDLAASGCLMGSKHEIFIQFAPIFLPKTIQTLLTFTKETPWGKLDTQIFEEYFGPNLSPLLLSQGSGQDARLLLSNECQRCLETFGYRLPKWASWYIPKDDQTAKKKERKSSSTIPSWAGMTIYTTST